MQTLDRLWVAYSKGKFGYSVQKDIWNSKVVKGDFSKFVEQIAWTTGPCGGCDKICSGCPGTLKRWTGIGAGGNEYCYDLDKAKKGHLPLTSALRGTYCETPQLPPLQSPPKPSPPLTTISSHSKNSPRLSLPSTRWPRRAESHRLGLHCFVTLTPSSLACLWTLVQCSSLS